MILGVVATLLVAGALAFGGLRTGGYHTRLANVDANVLAPLDQLNQSESEYRQSQRVLGEALASGDPRTAAPLLAESLNHSTTAEGLWRQVEAAPARFSGEEAARQRVDQAIVVNATTGQALGVEALSPQSDPTRLKTLTEDQHAAYLTLQTELGTLANDDYEPAVSAELNSLQDDADNTAASLRYGLGLVILIGLSLTLYAYRRTARAEAIARSERRDQELIAEENALDATLQHAFDMADDETQVFSVVERALATPAEPRPDQLLIADTESGVFVAAVEGADMGRNCPVDGPARCPAARTGQRLTFDSSTALDACWHLGQHGSGPLSAVCVPVTISGQTVGILHEARADHHPPEGHRVRQLEIVARRAGERLSTLRSFARSEERASTDPLTGLLNRRSLEAEVAALEHGGRGYALAFADLDHFKELNDTYGHEVGDQALGLFCTVLAANVRPGDIVARYGGEEFVVVLPDCLVDDAVPVLDRVQAALAEAVHATGGPPFTVSVGIAGADGPGFDETLAVADANLLEAKQQGRNRIVVGAPGAAEGPVGGAGAALGLWASE